MTVMWSASSFCYYMMQVYNKYLEGTIYKNVFYESLSGIFAVSLASPIYSKYSTKVTFLFFDRWYVVDSADPSIDRISLSVIARSRRITDEPVHA